MLLLRLGFLGDVAVDRIRTPWEMRQPRSEHDGSVPAAAASLGSLLGPRHAGAVPEYTIRCLPDQVPWLTFRHDSTLADKRP